MLTEGCHFAHHYHTDTYSITASAWQPPDHISRKLTTSCSSGYTCATMCSLVWSQHHRELLHSVILGLGSVAVCLCAQCDVWLLTHTTKLQVARQDVNLTRCGWRHSIYLQQVYTPLMGQHLLLHKGTWVSCMQINLEPCKGKGHSKTTHVSLRH